MQNIWAWRMSSRFDELGKKVKVFGGRRRRKISSSNNPRPRVWVAGGGSRGGSSVKVSPGDYVADTWASSVKATFFPVIRMEPFSSLYLENAHRQLRARIWKSVCALLEIQAKVKWARDGECNPQTSKLKLTESESRITYKYGFKLDA